MDTLRYEHRHLDVTRELETAEAGARNAEWRRLRDESVVGVEAIPGGVRLWLRPAAAPTATDLARREGDCCGFLDLELASEGSRLRLDITSSAPGAGAVIDCLTGNGAGCELGCC
jgi:hypothetical protein